jgi:hypothetical protein
MAYGKVFTLASCNSITGNTVTLAAMTVTPADAAGTAWANAAASLVAADLQVSGDIHGLLYFPFGDPDTLDGVLQPADLKSAEIKLTDGGAGAAVALIAEEIFGY